MFARAHRILRLAKRFRRARDGAAAVEFALVALPFFLLTFGLAEVAMVGFAQSSLNFAVAEAGRLVRTGEAQTSGMSYTQIQNNICTTLNRFMVLNCIDTLYLDVRRYDSFIDAAGQASPIQNGQFDDAGFGYNPGQSSDIVVIRAYYRWHTITPMFESILGNIDSGERILTSSMMFRNEPYQ